MRNRNLVMYGFILCFLLFASGTVIGQGSTIPTITYTTPTTMITTTITTITTYTTTTIPPLSAGAITPSSPVLDNGEEVILTAHPFGGSGVYTYQWYSDSSCNNPIGGATASIYGVMSTGTYYYKVTDTAPTPETACSAGDTVTVNLAITTTTTTTVSTTTVYPTPIIYSCDTYQTVYVGQNLTCGQFTLHLAALGSPNQAGQSPVSLLVYDNGILTNSSLVGEYNTTTFNIVGIRLYMNVGTTFAGQYNSQKWAQIQLGIIQSSTTLYISPSVTSFSMYPGTSYRFTVTTNLNELGSSTGLSASGINVTVLGSGQTNGYYNWVINVSASKSTPSGTYIIPLSTGSLQTGVKYSNVTMTVLPTTSQNANVRVQATDFNDPYLRDWNLFYNFPGAYLGNGNFQNRSAYTAYGYSGYNFYYNNLPASGTFYIVIGQSGGSAYGIYQGTIWLGTQSTVFSGLDANHALKVTYDTSSVPNIKSISVVPLPAASTITTTSTTTTTVTTLASTSIPAWNILSVHVQATDPNDPYLRDWDLFYNFPGAYLGNGNFQNRSVYTAYGYSGYNFYYNNLQTSVGTFYIVIGQSGGSAYGAYQGTIWLDNQSKVFSGLDANHALKVTYSPIVYMPATNGGFPYGNGTTTFSWSISVVPLPIIPTNVIPIKTNQTESYTIGLQPGWNLVSPALDTFNHDLRINYNASTTCSGLKTWAYDNGNGNYSRTNWYDQNFGKGYWAYTSSACSLTYYGEPVPNLATTVSEELAMGMLKGWNLMGIPLNISPISFSSITGSCNVIDGPYWYDPTLHTYVSSTVVVPGRGYFVNVADNCELYENSLPAPPPLP